MLLHARGTSGARELADLNALVADSVTLACGGSKAGGPEVRIEADYDASIGTVELATTDMSRVFINVIDNALYAMRQKGREQETGSAYEPVLSIKTRRAGDRVEVRIRDNGPGVPQAIADKIFNPFFTTKKPGEGTGLGLSLSHDIVVEGHHGTMRMDSAPGSHTEFVITLPKRGVSSKATPT
jgi:two-component system, NtrC family, sensor kinase